MARAFMWVATLLLVLIGCDDTPKPDSPSDAKPASAATASPGVASTPPARSASQFRDVSESLGSFFPGSQTPAAVPSASQLVGNWEAKIISVDLGPGSPPVDVAAMPPFQFSLAASGEGYRMTSADGARNVDLTVREGKLVSKQGAASQMRIAVDGQDLVGEIQGNNSVPRTVFRANKVR